MEAEREQQVSDSSSVDKRDDAERTDEEREVQAENELRANELRAKDTDGDEAQTDGELFPDDERKEAERRWLDIQAKFVDEPRGSVEEANELVGDLVERLVSGFGAERSRLEARWDRGDDVTTEDLRVALQRYRSFFGRLLDV